MLQLCYESCHRFTFALFTGVVAASSNLRQEIGAQDDNFKAKLLVPDTGTSILRTFSSFKHDSIVSPIHSNSHGNHCTGSETMEPLEERDHQQLRELEAKSGVYSVTRH